MMDRALFEMELFFQKPSWDECGWGRGQAYRRRSFPRPDRLSLEEPPALIGKADRGNELRDVKKHTGQAVCG